MTDVGDIFDDDVFRDTVETPKEDIKQLKKGERLKSVIDKSKGYLLEKWTHERVGKASDETINKKNSEYKQSGLN